MINLELDPQGTPDLSAGNPTAEESAKDIAKESPKESAATPAAPPDWSAFFSPPPGSIQRQGASARASPSGHRWPNLRRARMAWTGTWPGSTRPMRVEAAAFHGKPVFFSLIGDWTKPQRMKDTEEEHHRPESSAGLSG